MKYVNETACPFEGWHGKEPCKHGRALVGAALEVAENIGVTKPKVNRPIPQLHRARAAATGHLESCLQCQFAS